MSVLEISALNKRYGTVQAVKDISFTLESGDILGIVGESGCGKTSLLRLISGLEAADSGQVLLHGRPLTVKRSKADYRAMQMIFQDTAGSFHPRRRIADTIQDSVRSLLGRTLCRENHMATLFVSHDLAVVGSLCGRVLVMKDGHMVEQGPTQQILQAPTEAYTRKLIASVMELQQR